MADKLSRQDCIILLQSKYADLQAEGHSRYPCRSDFSEREVMSIKAFLGPWPRALEISGLKPPKCDDRQKKNAEKRIRAKQKRIAELKMQKLSQGSNENAE